MMQIGTRGEMSGSPDLPVGRSRSGCGACRAEGGDEHVKERIRRCVTERAQETTPGSAASAPEMPARAGRFGLGRRRAREGAHPAVRNRARAGDDAPLARPAPKMRVRFGGFGLGPKEFGRRNDTLPEDARLCPAQVEDGGWLS